jgi:hypothetical protein
MIIYNLKFINSAMPAIIAQKAKHTTIRKPITFLLTFLALTFQVLNTSIASRMTGR